jgi:hypothetical protein
MLSEHCLRPSGYFTYHQVQHVLPTRLIYVFCVDLGTNSYYFPIQHSLTGFYNLDGVCLLRGTDWICNSNWDWFSTLLQAVRGPPRTAEIRVAPRASLLGICDMHSGTGRCFHRARRFSPVNTIPPLLHTHLDLNTTLTRSTSGRNL